MRNETTKTNNNENTTNKEMETMRNETKKYYYFLGENVSEYGVENGRVDYQTLASTFDAVINNEIINKTQNIGYWEQVNGFIDNTEEIEELKEKIEELEDLEDVEDEIEELEEKIEELEHEQENAPEVFQYYIISDEGARILKQYTEEIVYYNEALDLYVWGVTHYGTAWAYVLTDIKLNNWTAEE